MDDILGNIPEGKRRTMALAYGLSLVILISGLMIWANSGEVDMQTLKSIDPIVLLLSQAVLSAIGFIGLSALFSFVFLKRGLLEWFGAIDIYSLGWTFIITLVAMVVISAVGEWNMSLDLGNSQFAQWARQTEDQLKVAVEHVTHFTSFSHFAVALVAIALIPAIGEELLFRGLIQNLFIKAFNNHHIAIWFTGLVFAAIHLQFFGLAPRMLLGVLFGYLYYWSGSLPIAMLAHFINNGFTITMLMLSQNGVIEISAEDMESAPPYYVIMLFLAAGLALLWMFKKFYSQRAHV